MNIKKVLFIVAIAAISSGALAKTPHAAKTGANATSQQDSSAAGSTATHKKHKKHSKKN